LNRKEEEVIVSIEGKFSALEKNIDDKLRRALKARDIVNRN